MLSKFLVSKSLSQITMSKFYEIGSWGQTHKTFLGCSKIVLILYGATTLGIMTHSMVTFSKMAPGIMVGSSSSILMFGQLSFPEWLSQKIRPLCVSFGSSRCVFWPQSLDGSWGQHFADCWWSERDFRPAAQTSPLCINIIILLINFIKVI